MLIDSVLFSNLPHSSAKKLIEKLKKLSGKRFKPKVRHVYNLSSLKRSDNEQIMNSIDVISDAISTHKKSASSTITTVLILNSTRAGQSLTKSVRFKW